MIQIEAVSANDAYLKTAAVMRWHSVPVRGRQQGTLYELRNVSITLKEPRKCLVSVPWRKLSRKYAAAEFLLFSGMETSVDAYAHYAKKWRELDVDGTVCSAYGERLFSPDRDPLPREQKVSRFDYALNQLLENAHSKNAVIMMRDWTDNRPTHQKDRCCTLFIQFSIRNGRLDMTVYMRSSDYWFGLPYDLFWYSSVMQKMLYAYNARQSEDKRVALGEYTHICASLHVYEAEWSKFARSDETVLAHHPEADYAFPVWDEHTEQELPFMLGWEYELRAGASTPALSAVRLRDRKLHPFMETIGSYLVNTIKTRTATDEDKKMILLAERAAGLSRCVDRQVGSVIIGESGTLYSACNDVIECNQNCSDKTNRICNVTHSEVAALRLVREAGDTPVRAYVTLCPCLPCMNALKEAGVKEVIVKGFSHKGAAGELTLLDPAFF